MKETEEVREGHIVVVGQWRGGHGKLPVVYADSVRTAGGDPKIFSTFDLIPNEPIAQGLDVYTGIDPDDASCLDGAVGLVLPGGGDIDPAWYGQRRHPRTHNVNHKRDRFELTLLAEALDRDIPVLAICHGMQLLNVQLGGTLDQHLADVPSRLPHDGGTPKAGTAHSVTVKRGSLLAEALGNEQVGVNTSHHQGLDVLADGLEEVAWAEDGVLEAVELRDHSWVVGVQWHPEAMAASDPQQMNLFREFVRAGRALEESRVPERLVS